MKNIIPFLMLCIGYANSLKAEDTDLSTISNVIYVAPCSIESGETATLSFCMNNTAPIRGFQFRLCLPEGFTAVENSNGKIKVSLSTERREEGDDHTINIAKQDDGSYILLCNSQYPESFTGNEGEIATLSVSVNKSMATGAYPIILKNIKLSETDISKYYTTETIETTLTVNNNTGIVLKGDVNGDGYVNVGDVITVYNIKAGNIPDNGRADVNGDGHVNVGDVITIYNIKAGNQ